MIRHIWLLPFIISACFARVHSPSPFIIGGEDAVTEELPWQAGIRNNVGNHICGGSLITHRYVLSSASCISTVISPDDVKIHLGAYRLLEKNKEEIVAAVEEIIVHPDYAQLKPANDIALLKTKEKVEFTAGIKPIALTTLEDQLNENEDVIISGWGFSHMWLFNGENPKKIEVCEKSFVIYECQAIIGISDCGVLKISKSNGSIGFSRDRLQRATVPVKTGENCKHIDEEKVWCVGNDRKGGCFDDGGGPLVKRVDGTWKLFGVLSYFHNYGRKCLTTDGASRYTQVGYYHKWIHDKISE